jgi:hypothetical protein
VSLLFLVSPLLLVLVVIFFFPGSWVQDLSWLIVLRGEGLMLGGLLWGLLLLRLVPDGLMLRQLLLLLLLLNDVMLELRVRSLELLLDVASIGPWIDRGGHSGPRHGPGDVECGGDGAVLLLHGRAAVGWGRLGLLVDLWLQDGSGDLRSGGVCLEKCGGWGDLLLLNMTLLLCGRLGGWNLLLLGDDDSLGLRMVGGYRAGY